MSIYSLKQGYYLYHDVEFVLKQIGELYKVDIKNGKAAAESIIELDKKNHFASPESKERFNAIVPKIKTLHTSMYHLLESIYRATDNQVFNTNTIENQFPDFKYFRMLNNKIKHFNEADIDLIEVVLMDGTKSIIEVGCQYKIGTTWEIKYYAQFIVMVLEILKELNIVSFDND
jgi:hypothetical protein